MVMRPGTEDASNGIETVPLARPFVNGREEELVAEEEYDDTRLRHAEYFVELAETLSSQLHTGRDLSARNQLEW